MFAHSERYGLKHLSQDFIEAIDGIDNGVLQYPQDIAPAYRNRTDLSSRVGHLNPRWNQSVDSAGVDVCVDVHLLNDILTANRFIGTFPTSFAANRLRVPWSFGLPRKCMAPGS